jgi:hypothetical protein
MEEYLTQSDWQQAIGMERQWVYPLDIPTVQYELEEEKIKQSGAKILEDGNKLIQFGAKYKVKNIVALYVRLDQIMEFMQNKYWMSAPSVQFMLPNTSVGYMRISGQYMVDPEAE